MIVGIHEAKTTLSRLVARAQAGEEIVIANNGRPVARLVPLPGHAAERRPGRFAGEIRVEPDFDAIPPGFEVFGA